MMDAQDPRLLFRNTKRKCMEGGIKEGSSKRQRSTLAEQRRRYTECELSVLTLAQLRTICKLNAWSEFGCHRVKRALLDYVNKMLLASQTALFDDEARRVFRGTLILNQDDPISLDSLADRHPSYVFRVATLDTSHRGSMRRVHQFCPMSLVGYILDSGKLCNPLTRAPLTGDQVSELEHRYVSYIRLARGAPKALSDLLKMRPDLERKRISPCPTQEMLGLEAPPVPVAGFAPWQDTRTLAVRAARALAQRSAEHQHEQTVLLLDSRASSVISSMLALIGAARHCGADRSSLLALRSILLNDFMRRFGVHLTDLWQLAPQTAASRAGAFLGQLEERRDMAQSVVELQLVELLKMRLSYCVATCAPRVVDPEGWRAGASRETQAAVDSILECPEWRLIDESLSLVAASLFEQL